MWEGHAQALREELTKINPAAPWNRQRIQDRREELARIEGRLARESERHAAFLNHRAELAARFHEFRDGPTCGR
jgi:chromosome segregation ATPase